MLNNIALIIWMTLDMYSLNNKNIIDEKNYEKMSMFFVGCNVHWCAEPLVIWFPEMNGYIKDFGGAIQRYV